MQAMKSPLTVGSSTCEEFTGTDRPRLADRCTSYYNKNEEDDECKHGPTNPAYHYLSFSGA